MDKKFKSVQLKYEIIETLRFKRWILLVLQKNILEQPDALKSLFDNHPDGICILEKHVTEVLEESKDELHSLMLLDLDGFKYVNDTFGHDIGDLLLLEVANRLKSVVTDNDFVARWGGDEFTVLQSHLENKADATALMTRIKEIIAEPLMIAGNTLYITASIGVSFFLEDGKYSRDTH